MLPRGFYQATPIVHPTRTMADLEPHTNAFKHTPFRQQLLDHAVKLGSDIAARSPVAMQGSKINLNYGRDHTLAQALQYQVATGRGADILPSGDDCLCWQLLKRECHVSVVGRLVFGVREWDVFLVSPLPLMLVVFL